MTDKEKIKALTDLANEALTLAADAWELADAYAGGESENADEISEKIDTLVEKFDSLTE